MFYRKARFLFPLILFAPPFLCALDVKIEEGKRAGSKIILRGTSSESPSTNAVITWWCTRAARLSGSRIFELNLSAANSTFSCLYSERDNDRVANCTCSASGSVGSQKFNVERVWSENTSRGESIFFRLSATSPVTSPEAGGMAAGLQEKLQVSPSYDFDRWVFLFDFSNDFRSGRDYSLGQVVTNGSGYTMSKKGNWTEYTPPESSGGQASVGDKNIFCALVRLQDKAIVDDNEAYTIIAERFGTTEDRVRRIVVSTVREFDRKGDYSIDRYCAGR